MVAVDGVHDLGGAAGFGPVLVEADEPTFHEPWEGRVFGVAGLVLLAGGFNTPMFRHAIERMEPAHYLSSSYYEHWLTALATLAVEGGLVEREPLVARAGDAAFPLSSPVAADPLLAPLDDRPADEARFAVDDRVRVRNVHPLGHTRCPDYVRGRVGRVVRVDPDCPIPELEAHAGVRLVEAAYCVVFTCDELWGDGDESSSVLVDLYDRYLEAP
jgi:nitrile hydratase